MTVYITAERLADLRELRDHVDAEIKRAEKILRNRQRPIGNAARQPAARVPTIVIRGWLRDQGIAVGTKGRISDTYRQMYADAHQDAS